MIQHSNYTSIFHRALRLLFIYMYIYLRYYQIPLMVLVSCLITNLSKSLLGQMVGERKCLNLPVDSEKTGLQ